MMTLLAYIIVVFSGLFSLTFGVFLGGLVPTLMLFWVPGKVGILLRIFLVGLGGGFIAVGFGYVVFTWLVGPEAFGFWPLLATILPIGVPLAQDYNICVQLKQNVEGADKAHKMVAAQFVAKKGAQVLSEALGVLAGAIWFFCK